MMVQWLRLCFPMHGVGVQSLIRELRSHMLWGVPKKNYFFLRINFLKDVNDNSICRIEKETQIYRTVF